MRGELIREVRALDTMNVVVVYYLDWLGRRKRLFKYYQVPMYGAIKFIHPLPATDKLQSLIDYERGIRTEYPDCYRRNLYTIERFEILDTKMYAEFKSRKKRFEVKTRQKSWAEFRHSYRQLWKMKHKDDIPPTIFSY